MIVLVKYSRHLINSDYFINYLAAYEGMRHLSDLIKNILICVPKMNESLKRLEQHVITDRIKIFGVN